jgi:hypothetical protein
MSQPLSNPPLGPPPKSRGLSTLMIVLIVVGLLGLICCGACGGCMYWGANAAFKTRDEVVQKISLDPAVKDKFGEPLTPGLPNIQIVNSNTTLDFPISGPKGSGTVHAEGVSGVNGFEASVIRVTAPDGTVINVSGEVDKTDITTPDFDMELEGLDAEK